MLEKYKNFRENLDKLRLLQEKRNLRIHYNKGLGSGTYRVSVYESDGTPVISLADKVENEYLVVEKLVNYLEKRSD